MLCFIQQRKLLSYIYHDKWKQNPWAFLDILIYLSKFLQHIYSLKIREIAIADYVMIQ